MGVKKWAAGIAVAAGAVAVAVFMLVGSAASAAEPSVVKTRYDELVAKALGITVEQLNAARTTARGELADELLAAGEITAEQAERIRSGEGPHAGFPGGRGLHPMGGIGRGFAVHMDIADTAAKVIGISPEELRTQIRAGKTIVQVASEKGVSRETLKTGIVTAETAEIQAAVTAGRITQAQADRIVAGLSDRIDLIIDGNGPAGFQRMDGDHEFRGGPRMPRMPGGTQ